MTNEQQQLVDKVAQAIWDVWDCPEDDDERIRVYAQAAISAIQPSVSVNEGILDALNKIQSLAYQAWNSSIEDHTCQTVLAIRDLAKQAITNATSAKVYNDPQESIESDLILGEPYTDRNGNECQDVLGVKKESIKTHRDKNEIDLTLTQRIKYLEGQIDSARNHISKGWNGSAASLLDACKPYEQYIPL